MPGDNMIERFNEAQPGDAVTGEDLEATASPGRITFWFGRHPSMRRSRIPFGCITAQMVFIVALCYAVFVRSHIIGIVLAVISVPVLFVLVTVASRFVRRYVTRKWRSYRAFDIDTTTGEITIHRVPRQEEKLSIDDIDFFLSYLDTAKYPLHDVLYAVLKDETAVDIVCDPLIHLVNADHALKVLGHVCARPVLSLSEVRGNNPDASVKAGPDGKPHIADRKSLFEKATILYEPPSDKAAE